MDALAAAQRRIAALEESERRWRRIVETLPQPIWTATADGRPDYFGPRTAALTGVPADRLLERGGRGWLEVIHPDDRASTARSWMAALAHASPFETEHRIRCHDHAYRWFSSRAEPLRDEDGAVLQWVGVSIEIPDRAGLGERAHEARDRFQRVAEGTDLTLWEFTLGSDGRVGTSRGEGTDFTACMVAAGIAPDDRARVTAAIQACVDGERSTFGVEFQSCLDGGPPRWWLARGTVGRAPDRRPRSFTIIGVEITHLKRAEDESRGVKERLELALRGAQVSIFDFAIANGSVTPDPFESYNVWESRGHDAKLPAADYQTGLELLVATEHQGRVAGAIQACIRGEFADVNVEYRAAGYEDREDHWRIARGTVLRDPSGAPVRLVGSSLDITQLKQTENEKRRATERLELATKLSKVYVWIFELHDGRLADATATLINVWESLGYDELPSEIDFATSFALALLPEDQERVLRAVEACVRGDTPDFEAEYRVRHKDGSIHWNLARGLVTRDEVGNPVRFLGTSVDITELKRIEEEARRSKERLELAVLGSRACTWDFELDDGTIANSRATYTNVWESLGYQASESPGHFPESMALLIADEDRPSFIGSVQGFLDGREAQWSAEYRVRHRDGSDRWHLARGVAARDATGRANRLTGTSVDITSYKVLEAALRASEERFRATFENAAVGMVVSDAKGRVLECNGRICELLGYERDELLGRSFKDFTMTEDLPEDLESRRLVVAGVLPRFSRDKQYPRKDGSSVWTNMTASVIQREPDGTASQLMSIVQDISERKSLEEDLLKARRRVELGVRGSNVGIFEFDMPDGDIAAGSQRFVNCWEMIGVAPASAPTSFEEAALLLIHPEDRPRVLQHLASYLESRQEHFEVEHRILHSDGSVRWRLSRGTAVRGDDGKPRYFSGSMIDITNIKRIEVELQRAREAAESANRAKDQFLANVSHEIRTPMNAILGMTELALDASRSARQKQMLETVQSAGRNLLAIIDDLLDFSKIEAGKLALDEADFGLRATLVDTLRALATRAHGKGLEVRCHVDPDVPDALFGDAGRFRQVLTNLVGNAIKFTASGEVVIEVKDGAVSTIDAETVSLLITVRDTGIGIAPDKQATIFRAFEQEDPSTTRKYGGTGLGLTISSQLAGLLGGEITVQSAPGQGSTFAFTSRFCRSSKPHSSTGKPGEAPSATLEASHETTLASVQLGGRSSLRILVAEDNALNVTLLQELLGQHGHLAQVATDGRAALALATAGEFDVLLLDLHMPEVDGFGVVRAIREHERMTSRHLPIIALTARSTARDRERCLAAGMDDFLSKPIEAEALWAAIRRAVMAFPPTRAESRLLDSGAILRACGRRPSVLAKLCEVFRRSLPVQMARTQAALAAGDFAILREAAHSLFGTLAAFSTAASAVAITLEDAATEGDAERCAALVHRLDAMCTELLEDTRGLTIERLG